MFLCGIYGIETVNYEKLLAKLFNTLLIIRPAGDDTGCELKITKQMAGYQI